jgi:3-deoxy-D-arabino-heptulosonate 7-phosphate (DAHP) synthase class II
LECDGNFDKTQYKSLCDPRLNDQQAINIMRLINRQWQF